MIVLWIVLSEFLVELFLVYFLQKESVLEKLRTIVFCTVNKGKMLLSVPIVLYRLRLVKRKKVVLWG